MRSDRSLEIHLVVFAFRRPEDGRYGAYAYYFQTGSTPPMPGIVDGSGNIDFTKAPAFDPKLWSASVDITLSMVGFCAQADGTLTPVTWPALMDQNSHSSAVFVSDMHGKPTKEITASWAPNGGGNVILLDDRDADNNSYQFTPAVVVPALNNLLIRLDPVIKNGREG